MDKLNIKPRKHIDLYLFGSFLFSENPNDIDLAIIYDKKQISIEDAIRYRKDLENELLKKMTCSIDTILLSKEEELEMEFLSNAKHEVIFKNYTQH